VLFAGTLGESTSGSFSLYFDGSDVGLDKGSEDVDGLVLLNDGSLLISTEGALSVPGLAAADEDVVRFAGSFGAATSGSFTMYFDGTDVGMDKDVDGLASDGVGLYFSSRDSFTAGGVTYRREDVALFRGTLGAATSGTLEMFWDGSAHGATKDVGGIDLP
jgi:hypothetical protein